MPISEEQAEALKESINNLTSAVNTLIWRLEAFMKKLPVLVRAIKPSSGQAKK